MGEQQKYFTPEKSPKDGFQTKKDKQSLKGNSTESKDQEICKFMESLSESLRAEMLEKRGIQGILHIENLNPNFKYKSPVRHTVEETFVSKNKILRPINVKGGSQQHKNIDIKEIQLQKERAKVAKL